MAAKNLTAFLSQNAKKIDNDFYVVSERFVDPKTQKPVAWEIGCITAAENARLRRECMYTVQVPGKKGQFTQEFDANTYLAKLVVKCTVYPNLNAGELQASYGVQGAEALVTTMLSPAEFEDYSTKVLQVNGFQTGDEMVQEAKN